MCPWCISPQSIYLRFVTNDRLLALKAPEKIAKAMRGPDMLRGGDAYPDHLQPYEAIVRTGLKADLNPKGVPELPNAGWECAYNIVFDSPFCSKSGKPNRICV